MEDTIEVRRGGSLAEIGSTASFGSSNSCHETAPSFTPQF